MCVKGKHFDGKECGEIHLALSMVNYVPSALNPLCSLWLFSEFSVLNSEKLNTARRSRNQKCEDHIPAGIASWGNISARHAKNLRISSTEATDTERAVEPQSLVDKKRVKDNRHGGVMQKARTSERGLIV
jgi:hypothetical protein